MCKKRHGNTRKGAEASKLNLTTLKERQEKRDLIVFFKTTNNLLASMLEWQKSLRK